MRAPLIFTFFLFLATGATAADDSGPELVFGVEPTHGARDAARDWSPVLDYLQQKTGVRLRFATTRNIPDFSARVEQGAYDFAVVNPADYLAHEDEDGYRAIVRARELRVKGTVVVRKDSSIESLDQLRAQSVAVPSGSFAADRVPMSKLREQGVDVVRYDAATAESVYRMVVEGRVAAGGGTPRTLNAIAPELRQQLRVLWTSEGYSAHAIVAHARVPQATIDAIKHALVEMSDDESGRALLKSFAPAGLDYGRDEDWNDVRELNM